MPAIDCFERAFETFAGGGPAWLLDRRREAFDKFREQGFPTLRTESWRFTRTGVLQKSEFKQPGPRPEEPGKPLDQLTFRDTNCHRLVFVDGHYAQGLSTTGEFPRGARVQSLAKAIAERPDTVEQHLGAVAQMEGHPFVALNTAFVADGAFVEIDAGVALEQPVHIVFLSTGTETVSHPRVLVVVGDNASVSLVETYAGTGSRYLSNAVVEFSCGRNSSVTHCRLQHESADAFHVANQQAVLSRDGRFSSENISIGAALARHDVGAVLDGEGIDCRLDGLYLADERQHVDNQTFIRHAKPRCHSYELYKGILSGRARGVFNGRIFVDPDAQKTDAKQENNCILLSDGARINTNPQLEIFADDVRCTHGATVGQLDEDAVFYLRSRGIPQDDARSMLIHAFAGEVLERIELPALREKLEVELFWWLSNPTASRAPDRTPDNMK